MLRVIFIRPSSGDGQRGEMERLFKAGTRPDARQMDFVPSTEPHEYVAACFAERNFASRGSARNWDVHCASDGCIKCFTGPERDGLPCFQKLETRLGPARAEFCREQLSGKFRFDFAIVPGFRGTAGKWVGLQRCGVSVPEGYRRIVGTSVKIVANELEGCKRIGRLQDNELTSELMNVLKRKVLRYLLWND